MSNPNLDKAVKIIKNSENIVVFSGAGISTESGIPDFRSENGIWSRYDPSLHANYFVFLENPEPFWTMHTELSEELDDAQPNAAHEAIAELEKMGKVNSVITQNIDMLHQKAGSGKYDDVPVYELHGSYAKIKCIDCGKEYELDEIDTKKEPYPVCKECSGYIKPKVILFGESLPVGVFNSAIRSVKGADCLLMIGSSLQISPANSIPSTAKQHGAKVIFINKEPTVMDDLADVIVQGKAAEIFSELMKKLK
jgi:NAD-dependent deacetylase